MLNKSTVIITSLAFLDNEENVKFNKYDMIKFAYYTHELASIIRLHSVHNSRIFRSSILYSKWILMFILSNFFTFSIFKYFVVIGLLVLVLVHLIFIIICRFCIKKKIGEVLLY